MSVKSLNILINKEKGLEYKNSELCKCPSCEVNIYSSFRYLCGVKIGATHPQLSIFYD